MPYLWDADSNANGAAESYGYTYSHNYAQCHTDGHSFGDRNGYPYGHVYRDEHDNSSAYTYSDRDCYSHSYGQANADCPTAINAKAASYARAAALTGTFTNAHDFAWRFGGAHACLAWRFRVAPKPNS